MKPLCLLITLSFFTFVSFAQDFQLINSGELLKKAIALHDEGKYEEALEQYRQITRNDTNYLHALSEMATTYLAMEEYDSVISICQNGLKEHSEVDYMFFNLLGTAYDDTKQPEKSLEIYLKGVEEYPANSLLHFNLGITLLGLGRQDEAIEYLKKAIDLDIYHTSSHYYLGKTLADQGRFAPAFITLSMFVLLENNGQRSVEIIKMLQSISSGGMDQPEVSYPEDQIFSELDLILRSGIALNKEYKTEVKENDSYVKQLQVMCEKMPEEQITDNFWMINYSPYFRNLPESDYLPFHTYFVFTSLNNDKVNKWLEKNQSKRSDFVSWAEYQLNDTRSNKVITSGGKIELVSCLFYNNGNLEGIGKMGTSGTGEDIMIGPWTFYYSTGNIQAGGMYNSAGQRIGDWMWYYADGTLKEIVYYEEDIIQRNNLQYHSNGQLHYEIPYLNSAIDGLAIEFSTTGTLIYEGEYEKGQNQGYEKYYYLNGKIKYHYFYENGQGDSITREYYPDGSLKREFFLKNGELNGLDKDYYENGKLKSVGEFTNGIQTGPWKWYYESGNIQNEGELDNGAFTGIYKSYYSTGKLEEEVRYSDGKLNGKASKWDRKGNLLANYTYLDDNLIEYTNFTPQGEIISTGKEEDGVVEFVSFFPEGMKETEGELVNGKRDGVWKTYYRNGNVDEETTYQDGKLNGPVKSYYKNGNLFAEYTLRDDAFDGFYKSYQKNGNVYSMGWYQVDQFQGDWFIYSADGKLSHRGYYLNDKPYGYQVYYHPDGKLHYEEKYEDGLIHCIILYDTTGLAVQKTELEKGNGDLTLLNAINNQPVITGEYKNGLLEGEVVRYLSQKKVQNRDHFMLGLKNGPSEKYTMDGKLKEKGSYLNGEQHGEWSYYHDNGQLSTTGVYQRDNRIGDWKWFYDTGELRRTGSYYNGFRDGEWNLYAPSGELIYRLYYDEGDILFYAYLDDSGNEIKIPLPQESGKITCYYPSGSKSAVFELKFGLREGPYEEYYPDGNLMFQDYFVADQRHGISKEFHPKGTSKRVETYYYGSLNGETILYDENGNIQRVEHYLLDAKHGDWTDYRNGSVLSAKKFMYDYLVSEE